MIHLKKSRRGSVKREVELGGGRVFSKRDSE